MASRVPHHEVTNTVDGTGSALQLLETSTGDELSRISQHIAQLAERDSSISADQDQSGVQLGGLYGAAKSANNGVSQSHRQSFPASMTLGKRKRGAISPSSALKSLNKRVRGNETTSFGSSGDQHATQVQSSVAVARAAGVHSAAALFRSPSASVAKKYTRPPMSKLYASLHLAPEAFLHLQAAAKTYMLDPDHPERRDCVGSRGKGDTDMVKLKLFNCVRDFLADGVGERFFPEHVNTADAIVDGPGFGDPASQSQQRWLWPRDGNQIVSLVTPLMRRVVTNERQRMYAVETRKGAPSRSDEGQILNMSGEAGHDPLDPSLQEALSTDIHDTTSRGHTASQPGSPLQDAVIARKLPAPPLTCPTNVLQFVFVHRGTKLLRFDWPDPDGRPNHAHMSFEKLTRTISDDLVGIQAAYADLNPLGSKSGGVALSISSQLARLKSKEAISAANVANGETRSRAIDPAHPSERREAMIRSNPDEAGEELRRALQLQVEKSDANDPKHSASAALDLAVQASNEPVATDKTLLDSTKVKIRALMPRGLVDITDQEAWAKARAECAETIWLEGCLRIIAEVSP